MEWEKLLCDKRYGREGEDSDQFAEYPFRTEFEKDRDRIVFSSAFRRLQAKTQVHPTPDTDYIRTRLTHSIEASSVGRSLGNFIGYKIFKKVTIGNYNATHIGDIVYSACLAHDIGNPPFGHSGEKAISDWFIKNKKILHNLTEAEKSDFLSFEGNAQGVRILTHLSGPCKMDNSFEAGGLQLTYATLGAFLKYPLVSGIPESAKGGYQSAKKYSIFKSERQVLADIATKLDLVRIDPKFEIWARHPLAYLVEAADDICYNIIDLEDACKLGLIDKGLAIEQLQNITIASIGESKLRPFNNLKIDNQISYLRAKAIHALIKEVTEIFQVREEQILDGTFKSTLFEEIEKAEIKDALETISSASVDQYYNSHKVLELEIFGYEILQYLLNQCIISLQELYNNSWKKKTLHPKFKLLLNLLQPPSSKVSSEYELFQIATDFVSGMTDVYAIDLFKKLEKFEKNEISINY
jgi:dGTPase